MTELQEIFIANLKRFRHEQSLSQSELAERINKATSLIGTIEIARTQPSFETIESIAKALNIPAYKLFLPAQETLSDSSIEARLSKLEKDFAVFSLETRKDIDGLKIAVIK